LLRLRIRGGGPGEDCDGSCCRHGAYATTEERDRIRAYAPQIERHMDATQPRRVADWFSTRAHPDEDFPDGVSYGTRVHRRKCVFRTQAGLCSLQATEADVTLPRGQHLKPFPCYLFPLTTDAGRIDFDPLVEGLRPCCTRARGGATRGVRAWAFEFRLVLGRVGYRRLLTRLRLAPRALRR
jgi:hypothetical protein